MDERALPGNLRNGRKNIFPPPNIVSLTISPPHVLLSLDLSFFQALKGYYEQKIHHFSFAENLVIPCDSKLLSGFPWPLDFFLWGYVKEIVYKNPVASIDELKLRIVAAIETLHRKSWRTLVGKLNTAWTIYVS
jgi:hypothetical protein